MFKTVLLPVDLSAPESWAQALPAALKMGGDDLVLHVVSVMPDFGAAIVGDHFSDDFVQRALHDLGETLAGWVRANVPDHVEVHPHVLHGRIYSKILEAANRLEVDAIVMGSHTPTAADFLLGPNAARVVRHAKQSVFVVRPPA